MSAMRAASTGATAAGRLGVARRMESGRRRYTGGEMAEEIYRREDGGGDIPEGLKMRKDLAYFGFIIKNYTSVR